MNEKTVFEGAEKCAESHVLRAESHTQHNGNVKKRLCQNEKSLSECRVILNEVKNLNT